MDTLIPKQGAPPPSRGALLPGTYWDVQLARYVAPDDPAWELDSGAWLAEAADQLRREK